MSDKAGSVALVGGSGLVGTALAAHLGASSRRVLVVDRAAPRAARATPSSATATKTASFVRVDLTDDGAEDALLAAWSTHAVDVVVHLAARVDPPGDDDDRTRMRRLHEHGTRAAVRAARRAGVRRFVLVSSTVVYGAWPDNPVPLAVDAPVRPCAFPYAMDKALQERVARAAWREDGDGDDDDGLAIVRPGIVYAPQARSYLTEILRRVRLPLPSLLRRSGLPRGALPALNGHRPPLQFVHVDDVAAVLAAVVDHEGAGVFHAASADWLAYEDVARAAGLAVVDVDARLTGAVLDRLVPWLPPSLRAPSSLFPYLMHPFVVSMTTTAARLGVRPRWSSREALQAMLDGPGADR
ncbi:MAG: NAD-dependent epimerase/dehydratase family protein [Deltaproteobacteria bacterium]|nr:NAD-dependent epimerase/dehydratase family protein [Deltaproteobacteria bacterium]